MKIREVKQKAENLIEQGENAKQRQVHYQQAANAARSQVVAAYARLEAAASETDEEGNPTGDVSGARAEVYAAQALLESAEAGLAEANQQLESIGRRKMETVHEIERYEAVEEGNMAKLAELQGKRFGANANAFLADLAARMNSGEQARLQLLSSLGIAASAKTFSAGGVGVAGSLGNATGYSEQESQTSNVVGSVFGGFWKGSKTSREKKNLLHDNSVTFTKYRSADEVPQEVWDVASDYQAYHVEKYNSIYRQGGTSDDIKRIRKVIEEHHIAEDTVFYRRASLDDLGESLKNLPLNELIGKRYQFKGIMSTSKNTKMASGDVVFEIKAPKGTPGLDLTDVSYFQEAMFDSPLCYIEDVKQDGYNTTHIVIKIFSSKEYHNIVDDLNVNGVKHNPIQEFGRKRTSEEIAARISGGDITEGSCSSLAFAFAGNEAGCDVLDFRDGQSRAFFSNRESIKKVANLPGVVSRIEYGNDDIACVSNLLQSIPTGKNYYLATGGHASIIRRSDSNSYEYLELQHPGDRNGWHALDENVLFNRFGCSRNRYYQSSNFLLDVESLSTSQEFLDILGYINTNNYEQRKGSSGNVK